VLTTQTAHWFIERGFEAAELDRLPPAKDRETPRSRNSRIFVKRL